MKLVYFSWLRERVGVGEEEVELPDTVKTIADLFTWLTSRGENYQEALKHPDVVRVALDQQHVGDRNAPIADAREIALFPPMTGG